MIEFVSAAQDTGKLSDKASGIRHLALTVDDFGQMVDKLMAEKVEVVTEPVISPKGFKTFFFRDPDGNVLHLINRDVPM